jgi:ABC-2 type transport system permease protein
MSTMTSAVAPARAAEREARTLAPSFPGMVRGELFKLARQRLNWVLLLMVAGATSIYFVFLLGISGAKDNIQADALSTLTHLMARELAIIRSFIGIALLIATAQMFGLEYQQGTIRVLLSRGVGRVQLLLAKLTAMAGVALVLLAGCLALAAALTCADLLLLTGSLDALSTLNGDFWHAMGLYLVSVLVSMGATILLAMAVTVVSRSLSFGLGASLSWFAADNILVGILFLVAGLTKSDFWLQLPAYFLGPELNVLPQAFVPSYRGYPLESIGPTPYVVYDATHAFLVALAYSTVFLAVSVVLTWHRDVLE